MRKLAKQKKLSRKEWLKGFLFGTDGKFYIVVDTIFSDRGESCEDDFYYTKEQFREKFIRKPSCGNFGEDRRTNRILDKIEIT